MLMVNESGVCISAWGKMLCYCNVPESQETSISARKMWELESSTGADQGGNWHAVRSCENNRGEMKSLVWIYRK